MAAAVRALWHVERRPTGELDSEALQCRKRTATWRSQRAPSWNRRALPLVPVQTLSRDVAKPVLCAVRRFHAHDAVVQPLVKLVAGVAKMDGGEFTPSLVKAGAGTALLRALKLGEGKVEKKTALDTAELLRLLAARPGCCLLLHQQGAATADGILLHGSRSSSVYMACPALKTLAAFAAHPHVHGKLLADGAVPKLLALAERFFDDAPTCEVACRTIATLASSHWISGGSASVTAA